MGKGAGCFPSKNPKPPSTTTAAAAATVIPDPPPDSPAFSSSSSIPTSSTTPPPPPPPHPPLKLFIIFYSMYGHVESLAHRIKSGADSVPGIQSILFRVPETLSDDVLDQMRAPRKDESIPVLKVEELVEADGVLFGFPTRYGAMAAQMKAFWDETGGLWKEQKLAGKPAGIFVSTGTQGGGQETTAWTAITQLAHHGMLFVPIGYTFGAGMFKMDSIRGGSPYGAGVFAGDGTREPSDTELSLAEHQGKYMASVVKKLAQR